MLLITLLLFRMGLAQESPAVLLFDESLNKFYNVRDFCISEQENEAFFSIQSPDGKISQIVSIKKENNKWSEPVLMFFCDENMYLEPFLAPDNKRLFFVSDRPNNSSKERKKNFDIWYVERSDVGKSWSAPVNIGNPVNSEQDEFYPTLSENGNLYFTLNSPNGMGKDDIYCCKWNGKNYSAPQLLPTTINSSGYEFNAFISKDERFLLYTKYNAEKGFGSGDLYISKRDANGNWQQAENLGNIINTPYMEYCPYYSFATNVLYFTSKRNSTIPQKFNSVEELQKYLNQENGLSKIYKIRVSF